MCLQFSGTHKTLSLLCANLYHQRFLSRIINNIHAHNKYNVALLQAVWKPHPTILNCILSRPFLLLMSDAKNGFIHFNLLLIEAQAQARPHFRLFGGICFILPWQRERKRTFCQMKGFHMPSIMKACLFLCIRRQRAY